MSVAYIAPEMLPRIMEPTSALLDQLGGYLSPRFRVEPVEPIAVNVSGLNPRAWPPCAHCGGNINCENYDPDTSAPLWGQDNQEGTRA